MHLLNAVNLSNRVRSAIYTRLVKGAFASFGQESSIQAPCRLSSVQNIRIGSGVVVGQGSWLQTLPGGERDPILEIGDGTRMSGYCVLSAAQEVRLGRNVLLARNVYISDHIHRYDSPDVPIHAQGVAKVRPVSIEENCWLGQNVVVTPGVTVGRGSVVAANSVVTQDVPPRSLVAGAPAVVRKRLPEP